MSWKSPWSYPLHEVEFCGCDTGQDAKAHWAERSKTQRQSRLKSLFEGAGVPVLFRDLTLESYIELAGSDNAKTHGIQAATDIIEHGKHKGRDSLFVTGPYGTGKTGLVTPVLRYWLDQGKTGLWIEFYDFTDEIQRRYATGDAVDALEAAKEAEWVLLDDVGDAQRNHGASGFTETTDKQRILYQLINHRHNHGLPTLITSNLSPSQFAEQFGARTMERVIEAFAIVEVGGRNLRM